MAVYCVSDLHGRFDLFEMLLEKIKFNPQKDKLYILGDVIDRDYGGIKIIDYAIKYNKSIFMILGNHESHFLMMTKSYDIIMFNPQIKDAMKKVVEVYSSNLYTEISKSFKKNLSYKKKSAFTNDATIKKWLKQDKTGKRNILLDNMISLAKTIDYDEEIYSSISWVLNNLDGSFKTKNFVKELLEKTTEEYIEIKDFLNSLSNKYEFDYSGNHFVLVHWKGEINKKVSRKLNFPHAKTQNTIFVYGHDPVPSMHRKINGHVNSFDFDYRKIFSWIDVDKNRYYCIDLASNPVAALKLDDMSEYYVGLPYARKNAKAWTVSENIFPKMERYYKVLEEARLASVSFRNSAIITYDKGCYEFLIGIDKKRKKVCYSPIGWLEFKQAFAIDDWDETSTIEEIIEKVRIDFEKKQSSDEYIQIYNLLHGIR